ncbi:MAG TPA: DUF445 domain-containing protein [Candidatus Brocadiia bacterium]|nr:DUF445 family protein [Planctomycetota bacterium]MBI4007098.1 DUF445 family protein [Planctomycetota bacterium]MDO8093903.1 DUF445 family protein [Candidatus Brocadiales bacterium]
MDYKLFSLPIIGAIIGWMANRIALRMLFRPRNPIKIFGFKIQGVFPKRRTELAHAIGHTVQKEFEFHNDIKEILTDGKHLESFKAAIKDAVDNFIERRLTFTSPLLTSFLPYGAIVKFKEKITDEIMRFIPELAEGLTLELENKLDLKEAVVSKLEAYEMSRIEEIVLSISARELRYVKIIGAIIGFLIGVIQLLMIRLLRF